MPLCKLAWSLTAAMTLSLCLLFGFSVNTYRELHNNDIQVLIESKQYTDTRIQESQNATQGAIADVSKSISDVSKATVLLSRILCLMQAHDVTECERQLGPPTTPLPTYKDK